MREIASAENPHADKQAAERNRERPQSDQEGTFRGAREGAFAHQRPEACDGHETRKERPEKILAIGMIGYIEKPERGERAEDGAECVHQALETECAAVGVGWSVSGQKRLARRGAHAATKPGSGAADKHLVGVRSQTERCRAQRRKRVAKYGEGLAALHPVGVVAGDELCDTRQTVGHALDDPEPRRPCANRCKKSRQHRRGCFVAPVAKQAGEANAKNGAAEPGLFFCGLWHRRAVYRTSRPVPGGLCHSETLLEMSGDGLPPSASHLQPGLAAKAAENGE